MIVKIIKEKKRKNCNILEIYVVGTDFSKHK